PKISIGYDFKVYIPKDIAENFKSKYDLALELIKDAYRRGLIKKIYFDSWRGVSQDCQAILWIRRLSGY
ncbi:MAG: hypothetical protein U9R34_03210, partial [Nanoarchaeota archaeon]|nr:hypothetical protein [Nanoarchaeota archaeon]